MKKSHTYVVNKTAHHISQQEIVPDYATKTERLVVFLYTTTYQSNTSQDLFYHQ